MSKLDKPITARKAIALGLICILIGVIFGAVYVYASSPTTFQVITSGPVPGSATFTVFKDGSVYYAKNLYGGISYSSQNASYVFNSALSVGSVYVLPGSYSLTNPIVIDDSSRKLYGENERSTIITQTTVDTDVLYVGVSSSYIETVEVCGLSLVGSGGATTGRGLNIQGAVLYSNYHDLLISDCYDGVMMNATYANRAYRSYVSNIHISDCGNIGMALYQQDGHTLRHINIQNCLYGLRIDYLSQGIIAEGIRTDAITYTGIQICGQGIKLYSPFVSESGAYGIQIHGGSHDIEINDCWVEASGEDQIYLTNDVGYEFDIFDVKIKGGTVVRGDAAGIKMTGANNKNITNILIDGVNIINNAQETGTSQGVYAWNQTLNVRIVNCFIGNWALDSGDYNQRGIGSDNTCDYWNVINNDLSNANVASVFRIVLAGTHNTNSSNVGYP